MIYFYQKISLLQYRLKDLNGVQNTYPRGTEFSGVQNGEMGDCTPKWGTFGNPDRMQWINQNKQYDKQQNTCIDICLLVQLAIESAIVAVEDKVCHFTTLLSKMIMHFSCSSCLHHFINRASELLQYGMMWHDLSWKKASYNTGYTKIISPPHMNIQNCLFYFNNE